MAGISLDAVDKVYPDGTQTVFELSLDIADGEFMVFVGPSGCGKTTALRMIAGLEDLAAGDIRIGDRSVNGLSPRERDIAMVFQNYALYPHMTVAENMAFGLQQRKFEKADIQRRVAEAAAMLGLTDLLSRKPAKLSGGQRQRVAMGRAIVRQPQAFLMDEPLSNLDARLRVAMRASLKQLHERLGVTTVYVTHDQVEAMTLADRAAVLCDGRLQQVDTPQRLFDQPANLFVAGFIGSPAMNLAHAELVGGQEPAVVIGQHRVPLPEHIVRERPGLDRYVGHPVIAGIRPSDFEAASHADPAWPRIPVTATVVEELGAETNVVFVVDAAPVDPLSFGRAVAEEADAALPLLDGGTSWTARVNVRAGVRQGGATELAVDPGRFHFFDPESGVAVGARELATEVAV